jgi:hypothetical protein
MTPTPHLSMTPHLAMIKAMKLVHGKLRPIIEVQAFIAPSERAFLLEHFHGETLFKRTAYSTGFSDGGLQPSPPLARMLANFVRNDACPEVTVKTLLSGQKYEASGLWDMQCFAFVAQRSFDGLCELAQASTGFDVTHRYFGFGVTPDAAAFAADTALEMAAGPAAIAVGGIQGMADAA